MGVGVRPRQAGWPGEAPRQVKGLKLRPVMVATNALRAKPIGPGGGRAQGHERKNSRTQEGWDCTG